MSLHPIAPPHTRPQLPPPAVPAGRDVRLLDRVAAGDRQAFTELFDRHAASTLSLLTPMLGRHDLAEEVLQETFLQVWRQAGRYRRERATPRGWLQLIARSRARDRLRSRGARHRREETACQGDPSSRDAPAVCVARLEALDRGREIREALGRLPGVQRDCIELAFYQGLSHSQIADRLDQPLGTVKSRILLGMKKLRLELAA